MIALLLTAAADPGALRAMGDVSVDLGAPTLSVATWGARVGVGGWVRTDGGSAGVGLGLRHLPARFGAVAHVSTGVLATLVEPGLGLHGSVAIGLGLRGNRALHRLQVVVPASAAHGRVRVPVLLEGSTVVGPGWRVAGRGAVGAILTDGRPALAVQGALVVSR